MESLSLWTEARFPNGAVRQLLLDQIRLWNRVEDLPAIQVVTRPDGVGLRYWCADYRRQGLRKLVGSYGGVILEQDFVAAAFDWS
jgi:hypothetical protein